MSSVHGELDVAPTESETTRMAGNFPHGSREAPETFVAHATDRSEKARGHTADAHVSGESDSSIVPQKQARPARGYPGQRAAVGGVCGGKGADQGERQAVATGLDSAPETQV